MIAVGVTIEAAINAAGADTTLGPDVLIVGFWALPPLILALVIHHWPTDRYLIASTVAMAGCAAVASATKIHDRAVDWGVPEGWQAWIPVAFISGLIFHGMRMEYLAGNEAGDQGLTDTVVAVVNKAPAALGALPPAPPATIAAPTATTAAKKGGTKKDCLTHLAGHPGADAAELVATVGCSERTAYRAIAEHRELKAVS